MTSSEFRLRKRVRLGGIPVIELRKALDELRDDAIITFRTSLWPQQADGSTLTSDGGRVPFEIAASSDRRELIIKIFRDRKDDKHFREQVLNGRWGIPADSIEAVAARLDPDEVRAARDVALADFKADLKKQERIEKQRDKHRNNF